MDWIGTALHLANNIFETGNRILEGREQKKFQHLYRAYKEEINKSEIDRDHDLIAWLEDDLAPFVNKAVTFTQG